MGEGGSGEHQATTSLMPDSALGADKRIHITKLKCVKYYRLTHIAYLNQ